MNKIKIKVLDHIFCQIENMPRDMIILLQSKLSYYAPNFKHNTLYNNGLWDGKRKFFEHNNKNNISITYKNLISFIVTELVKHNLGHLIDIDNKNQISNINLLNYETLFNNNGIILRDYQIEAVTQLLTYNDGFIVASTSAGKSKMIAAIAQTMNSNNKRSIFIAPRTDLVNQLKEDFEKLDIEHSIYVGSKKSDKGPAIISTFQTLSRNPDILKNIDCIMIDESHQMTATTIEKMMIDNCVHMQYRYGCTGTFPKDPHDQMILVCTVGPSRYNISAKVLIDNGTLSTVNITPYKVSPRNIEDNQYTFIDWTSQCKFLASHPDILECYKDIIINKHNEMKQNTLILVNSIALGEELEKMIPDSKFINGKQKSKERKEVYDEFQSDSSVIRIATTGIASTGISIDCIHLLVLIDLGKSFTKTIQSIGRGLRKNDKLGKDHIEVLDIFTSTNINNKHITTRKKYYKEAHYPVANTVKYEFNDKICG